MYGNGQAPIFILKDGTQRTRGRTAQSNNIAAAKAVADAVRSTLGPKGMDKMLVDSMGDVVITNDGATILKEMDIEHPAAKMIIEVAKTQEQHCFDGTTSAVILSSGELLKALAGWTAGAAVFGAVIGLIGFFIARAGLRKYQSRRQSRREQLLAEKEQATA